MQAIVVVSLRPQEATPPAKPAIVEKSNDALPKGVRSGKHESAGRDQVTLPFWTWFIENPPSNLIA